MGEVSSVVIDTEYSMTVQCIFTVNQSIERSTRLHVCCSRSVKDEVKTNPIK